MELCSGSPPGCHKRLPAKPPSRVRTTSRARPKRLATCLHLPYPPHPPKPPRTLPAAQIGTAACTGLAPGWSGASPPARTPATMPRRRARMHSVRSGRPGGSDRREHRPVTCLGGGVGGPRSASRHSGRRHQRSWPRRGHVRPRARWTPQRGKPTAWGGPRCGGRWGRGWEGGDGPVRCQVEGGSGRHRWVVWAQVGGQVASPGVPVTQVGGIGGHTRG